MDLGRFFQRWWSLAATVSALLLLLSSTQVCAAEGKRVALVMGNDAYQNVHKLEKAGNDASAMARELKSAGFEVTLARDLDYRSMIKKVEFFTSSLHGGDQVVIFFAGHGVQLKTGSYLLPIDIEANSENEVERTAVSLNDVMDKLGEAKASFALVMVDACRDNPLKANGRALGVSRGLNPPDPPKGQMVVYSASKGQQALDKLNEKDANPNGVFTREFIARMRQPGMRIEDLVRQVQDSVEDLAKSIGHVQRPALYNEARGDFYFFGPTTVPVVQAVATPPVYVPAGKTAEQIEDDTWDIVKGSADIESLEEFLRQYPKGRYVGQARVAIAKVKLDARRASGTAVAPEVPPAAVPVPMEAAAADAETALWKAIEAGRDVDDYRVYLTQYPSGKFVALARQRLQKLTEVNSAKAQAEEAAVWQAAEAAQTVDGYQAYEKRYPAGQYLALSQLRLRKLKPEVPRPQEVANRPSSVDALAQVAGVLVFKDPYSGVQQGQMEVVPVATTNGSKKWTSGDQISPDGGVVAVRFGNFVGTVQSGSLWSFPLKVGERGTGRVNFGSSMGTRQVDWKIGAANNSQIEVVASFTYENQSSASKISESMKENTEFLNAKWTGLYDPRAPLPLSFQLKISGSRSAGNNSMVGAWVAAAAQP